MNIYRPRRRPESCCLCSSRSASSPTPGRRNVLIRDSKRIMLNCSRQTGKSTIVAIIALRHALYTRTLLFLYYSTLYGRRPRRSGKCRDYYAIRPAGSFNRPSRSIGWSCQQKHELSLSVVSIPTRSVASAFRRFSPIIDEAAQVRTNHIMKPCGLWSRLVMGGSSSSRPRLADVVFFDRAWEDKSTWPKIEINADQCPRFTSGFS